MVSGSWYESGKSFSALATGVSTQLNKDNSKKKSGYLKAKIKIIFSTIKMNE